MCSSPLLSLWLDPASECLCDQQATPPTGEPGCSVVPLRPSFALRSWAETGRGRNGGHQRERRERLIVPRVLGLYGHVAGGFCGDLLPCRLCTWPASPHLLCPSLRQKVKGPSESLELPNYPSRVLGGPRRQQLSPQRQGGPWSLPGRTGFKFWVCHPLGDFKVSFKSPVPPCSPFSGGSA